MELKFSIETDELYGEDGIDFEDILTNALQKEVVKKCKEGLATDKFQKFSTLVADTILSGIKLKMENFLSEDIALTDGWGKPTFVGSIEDLMKKRFDEILLRPVDSSGKTLQGCTSPEQTWIEWKLKNNFEANLTRHIERAERNLEASIHSQVTAKITEIKDTALKQQVDAAFTSILLQDKK